MRVWLSELYLPCAQRGYGFTKLVPGAVQTWGAGAEEGSGWLVKGTFCSPRERCFPN